jgi:hypothetical protein
MSLAIEVRTVLQHHRAQLSCLTLAVPPGVFGRWVDIFGLKLTASPVALFTYSFCKTPVPKGN